MRTIRFGVAYDGTSYFGWQRQPGFPTIQEALEGALTRITGETVVVHGSGRTDTGVHAREQMAHVRTGTSLPDAVLQRALNAHLERDIRVLHARTVDGAFHARISARGKRYLYVIHNHGIEDPFARTRSWWVRHPLDLAAMRAGSRHLIGKHDFASFRTAGSSAKTTIRTVRSLRIVRQRAKILLLVQADGFLYNMVRAFVGTLVDVGRGAREPSEVRTILGARDRRTAGPTAPAQGLVLWRVLYPEPYDVPRWNDRIDPWAERGSVARTKPSQQDFN